MFRSEPMQHGALVLPTDRARDFIELLGKHCHIQFVDMNEDLLVRQYKRYIQRIDEMERVLRLLFEEINKVSGTKVVPADVDAFMDSDLGYQLDGVEEALKKVSDQFQRFRDNNSNLLAEKNIAKEEIAVVRAAQNSYAPGASTSGTAVGALHAAEGAASITTSEDAASGPSMGGFTNVAGMILTSEQEKFARTIFRVTRGNAFSHFEPIPESWTDAKTGKPVQKSVFVTYFQGSSTGGASALREKIMRICNAYGVNVYDWPKSYEDAQQRAARLEETIADRTRAMERCEGFFVAESAALLEVHRVGGGSLIEEYRLFCLKEKAIYTTLNLFEGARTTLRAYCWFPVSEEETIRRLLMSHSTRTQVSAFLLTDKNQRKHQQPPTYIRTTEFTSIFQSFVDTYGVPHYQEANPAVLTIITFPFLFGIMYGDIGHGACLLAFALYLFFALNKLQKSKDEIVQMIIGGRYMILFMSLFAVYAGFLYNDFFALALDIFGTRYSKQETVGSDIHFTMKNVGSPYPFGFDPIWKGATNELTFLNSFKMKFAVIVGGIQMTTGILLKGVNAIYFSDMLTLVFEAIPQLIFMLGFVGFMDFLIIYKWATPLSYDPYNKPQIVTNIIEMCMFQKPQIVMFNGQGILQKVCIIAMLVSVPLMLLVKPLVLLVTHGKKASRARHGDKQQLPGDEYAVTIRNVPVPMSSEDEDDEEEEEFDFGDVAIHQLIETIEFCLGTLSNTASYLRLWALSLAHQQLSLVFFQMTIQLILKLNVNEIVMGIALFFGFAVFAAITFGVMLCMDTLECFLHALRLQWVEFQNKFYKADGYAFVPFRFKPILTAHD